MSVVSRSTKVIFVIRDKATGHYLHHTAGYWGPRNMAYPDVTGAIRFTNAKDAREYATTCNWSRDRRWFELDRLSIATEIRKLP